MRGAEQEQTGNLPDKAEIEKVITRLEDPAQREELLNTLKILAKADNNEKKPNELVENVAAHALNTIAATVGQVTTSVGDVAETVNGFPSIASWLKKELADPQFRLQLSQVVTNLLLTLGLGFLAYWPARYISNRFLRMRARQEKYSIASKILAIPLCFLVKLLPVFFFALIAYPTLSFLAPRAETRLVALAWVNGFMLARVLVICFSMVFMPNIPRLRLVPLANESANYLMIWVRRLIYTATYGYFSLQAALLLGLPATPYNALLRLLGLFVAMLITVMILQNRESVATWLVQARFDRDLETEEDSANPPTGDKIASGRGLPVHLARIWHIFAILYVLLLFGVWALQIPGGFLFLFKATAFSILTMLIGWGAQETLRTFFHRGFSLSDELKRRFPGLEKRVNRYIATLYRILRASCYVLCLVIILEFWGLDTFTWLTSGSGKVIGSTLASIIAILIITFVIWEIINGLIENRLSSAAADSGMGGNARTLTLLTVSRKALSIVLIVVSGLMILSQLGINIAPLLAGAGVLGLAIGFGSQKLVQDVITGIFILLEDQMAVGDVVDLGGMGGVVEAVSIRTVRLRDISGTVHTIPFSTINTVSNKTKGFSYYVMDIGIGYRENVDEVMQVLQEIGASLQEQPEYGAVIIEPLEILGVDTFADSAVVIKARIKTVPGKQWSVGRAFNRRMKLKFDELDIEIPFPHQTIYFGVDKNGEAPYGRLSCRNEENPSGSRQ
ncbi:MAG: mechanosensitive ion channel domain-containing protein [Desulfopila sp.]